MRRAAWILLPFVLLSCYGAPQFVEPSPVPTATPAAGGRRPAADAPARATQPCQEVARVRCSSEDCGQAKTDYVTLRCTDGKIINRCVANTSCTAR